MRRYRSLFAVAVAVLVAAALTAVGALAASEWVVEGEPFSEIELAEEEESLNGGPLSLLVPSKGLIVECGEVSGSGTVLQGGTEEINASLSECVVPETSCEVAEPLALEAKTELIFAGGLNYEKVVPLSKEGAMMTVKLAGECEFAKETAVKGSVAAKVLPEELVERPMLFSESTSNAVNEALVEEEEAKLSLTFGAATAFLEGEWLAQLAGGRAGQAMDNEPFTRLCEGTQKAHGDCNGTVVASGGAINAKKITSMVFKYGTTTVTCTEAKIEGNTLSAGAAPLPAETTSFVFNNCNNNTCPVTALGTPYRLWFRAFYLAGIGTMAVRAPEFQIDCGGTICKFARDKALIFVKSGNPAKTEGGPISLNRTGGPAGTCGGSVSWKGAGGSEDIEYEFLTPKPLALTG